MPRHYTNLSERVARLDPHLVFNRLPRKDRVRLRRLAEEIGIELGGVERRVLEPYLQDGLNEGQQIRLLQMGMARYMRLNEGYWGPRFAEIDAVVQGLPLSDAAKASVRQTVKQMYETTALEVRSLSEEDYRSLCEQTAESQSLWVRRVRMTPDPQARWAVR
jgi:hypothetical protein